MEWIWQTLQWYLYLLAIGILFFPITKKLFGSFFDQGYGLSKTIGILTLTYAAFVLGIIKILPFNHLNLIFLVFIFGLINYFFSVRNISRSSHLLKIFIFEELLFLAALFFLTYVRGQEPSIRGLEKFMDFGFMNAILRAEYFPPLDMWLSADATRPSGYPINYYYFGHLSGAFLIKLSNTLPAVGYNLMLATILAQGTTIVFSLIGSSIAFIQTQVLKLKKLHLVALIVYALLGSFIVNLAGNLHTIYLFTTGYPNENPIPFWQILDGYNPTKYWYPNATRFIPFTIHEFPSYSYVVADLHGHVFDIPFVLLTLSLLLVFFLRVYGNHQESAQNSKLKTQNSVAYWLLTEIRNTKYLLLYTVLFGFLTAVHYMTNAFDGPIYLLLILLIFVVLFKLSWQLIIHTVILIAGFLVFSFPFSYFFSPFVTGVGVNCSPEFLVNLKKFGPFLFEKGNCQSSAPWMLFVLWGFFWSTAFMFMTILYRQRNRIPEMKKPDVFILILFAFGTFLIIIPEFFYIKDIYPAHFRANTMFKMGYQAFMMMGVAAAYVLYRIQMVHQPLRLILKSFYLLLFSLVFVYPFFAFPSYYGALKKTPQLDGTQWLKTTYTEDKEIIDYLNKNIVGTPVVLEAQGDSYTDYERISAYTGLPTIAGWWVHEWLWRGSSDVVGKRIPDVTTIYETNDSNVAIDLLRKYQVQYVIVSTLERNKYPKLQEEKFSHFAKKIYTSSNKLGALYQINTN